MREAIWNGKINTTISVIFMINYYICSSDKMLPICTALHCIHINDEIVPLHLHSMFSFGNGNKWFIKNKIEPEKNKAWINIKLLANQYLNHQVISYLSFCKLQKSDTFDKMYLLIISNKTKIWIPTTRMITVYFTRRKLFSHSLSILFLGKVFI